MNAPSSLFSPQDRLVLVDGSSYIFRAYHALPPLTRKSDGMPVGAVAGFCNMLWKLIRDEGTPLHATHLAVIFDPKGPTFRNALYPDYKAHRPPAPEDLVPQFALIHEAVQAFGVACIEVEGYEADDVMAAYAREAARCGASSIIVSSDKDLMQLVEDRIRMFDPMKDKHIDEAAVREKFGVEPARVVDVQALAGDSVDNVPGVPGIGLKTAAELINAFGSLETLLQEAHTIKQPKRRESLTTFADQARLSRELVLLADHAPRPLGAEALRVAQPEAETVLGFLNKMEFQTLTKRVATALGATAPMPQSLAAAGTEPKPQSAMTQQHPAASPQNALEIVRSHLLAVPWDVASYACLTEEATLSQWLKDAHNTGHLAIDTETDGLDAMQARLVGISLATRPGRAAYIPLGHTCGDDLFGDKAPVQLDSVTVQRLLQPVLQASSIRKIGHNLKFDLHILRRHGFTLTSLDDTLLMAYVLAGGQSGNGLDDCAARFLGHTAISFKDVTKDGRTQKTFDRVALPEATAYAAEDADMTLRLFQLMRPELIARGLLRVYETLDRPLIDVVTRMEASGIAVDKALLAQLSNSFASRMATMETEILAMAGESFNLASPKQLGDILFGKLGLPGGRKTSTGAWSTGADVLEDLAAEGHELPKKLLEWRQLAKLKSTYTDAIPTFINRQTGRVHTSYALAATTTGRFSSSDPNVQNIPVRNEEGRQIRKAFIAAEGMTLISADYSQIELRLLAHIADIPALKQAFADGVDIHALTASEMFGVPLPQVDGALRRRAKAINFGIIYGISAFGLANQLSISREEAGAYIKTYFERFPQIRTYMDDRKRQAHEQGYVETLFGRRIDIARAESRNAAERAFAERQAINAPIQGSAADIIRRAMIRMDEGLKAEGITARMLLQVHDELVFEATPHEAQKAIPVIRSLMENAAQPAVVLSVPLVVEARAATNWDEAH